MSVHMVALALGTERGDHGARFLGPSRTNLVSLAPVFIQGGRCSGKDDVPCPVDAANRSTSLSSVCNSDTSTGSYGTVCAGNRTCEEVCDSHNHAPFVWDTDPLNGHQPHPKLSFSIDAPCSEVTEADEFAMRRYFANRIGRGPRSRYPDLGRPKHLASGAANTKAPPVTWDYGTGTTSTPRRTSMIDRV